MRIGLFYPLASLALALCGTSTWAQTQYRERITFPNGANVGVDKPHDNPVTYDLSHLFPLNSGGRLAPGSATVTFASTPAPYIRAQAQHQSSGIVILAAEMSYGFAYTGPAMSFVPINFRGLFEVQHGYRNFNRSEVAVALSAPLESVGANINCGITCRAFPSMATGGTGLSTIQISMSATADVSLTGQSNATGSFAGVLMAATDAQGKGQGSISLYAFASALNSTPSFAFIDPELRIDTAFLAAHPGAGLTLPPGVGNAITAVPEPGAAWLMFGGLGLLGGVAARRRRG